MRGYAKEFVRIRLLALLDVPVLERRVTRDHELLTDLTVAQDETRALAEDAIRLATSPRRSALPSDETPTDSSSTAASASASASEAEQVYRAAARPIEQRHLLQTADTVATLRRRYADPVFGEVRVFELVERLAQCVDPTDCRLFGASQLTHVLQMIEAMDADGVLTPDLLLTTLIHDLGKLLLLTDEDPANVVCMNAPIGDHPEGAGLDNLTIQWNHDEFGYSRLVDHVPDHVSWLVRYHSLDPVTSRPLMDERDKRYADEYLQVFFHYDHETKSAFRVPKTHIDDYRDVIDEAFPNPISF